MKYGCAICIFLNSENLICRSTDISKCFRGSLQLRDNESRLCISAYNSRIWLNLNEDDGQNTKEAILSSFVRHLNAKYEKL